MNDLEAEEIIRKSPILILIWQWMQEVRPEEAECDDSEAFLSADGKHGPCPALFSDMLYSLAKNQRYLFGHITTPCQVAVTSGSELFVDFTPPYFFRYGLEYAQLYLDPPERERQHLFYSDLERRMQQVHSRAFADLRSRLDAFSLGCRFTTVTTATALCQDDVFAGYFTRENCIRVIANCHDLERIETLLDFIEKFVPKELHDKFLDDIEEKRDDNERRRQHTSQQHPTPQFNVTGDVVFDKHVGTQIGRAASPRQNPPT